MSQRSPAEVRQHDLIKTIVTIVLILILIALLVLRSFFARPSPIPTLVPSPSQTPALSNVPTFTPNPTETAPPTSSPTSSPTPAPTFTALPSPLATLDINQASGGGGGATPTLTLAPTHTLAPTFTLAPTRTLAPTATLIAVGTACPPYGARGEDLGSTYITVYCDTLSNIAERTGVSLQSLIAANPQIPNPNLIFSGNVVIIPAPRK
jgi:LysM repeat protein